MENKPVTATLTKSVAGSLLELVCIQKINMASEDAAETAIMLQMAKTQLRAILEDYNVQEKAAANEQANLEKAEEARKVAADIADKAPKPPRAERRRTKK